MTRFFRRRSFFNLFLVLLIILISFFLYRKNQSHNLNVILISVDTLRADSMSLYGYPKKTTPNIDKWAEKATVFENFRTTVPMTYPSFLALFTGQEPFDTRVSQNVSPAPSINLMTLPFILMNYGYKTAAFTTNGGKFGGIFDEFNTYLHKFFYLDDDENERYSFNPDESSNKVTGDAITWLNNNKNEKFFLWVHLVDPHTPYFPEEEYKCKFNSNYCTEIVERNYEEIDEERARFQMCRRNVPNEIIEKMKTLYDGEIAVADKYVGKILNEIESIGLDKKTLVIFYSDHGEGFDHNYYFNHREVLYESAVRVPLIIKNPLNIINRRSELMIQNTDFLPTVLDILKIDKSNYNLSGNSFEGELGLNLMRFTGNNQRKYTYGVNSSWTKFYIFDGRYKYIYSLPESCLLNGQTEEFYDIKKDPSESMNLKSHEKKVLLKNELFKYLSKYNLPFEINQGNNSEGTMYENGLNTKKELEETKIKSLGY